MTYLYPEPQLTWNAGALGQLSSVDPPERGFTDGEHGPHGVQLD